MTDFKDITKILKEGALTSEAKHLEEYLKYEVEIIEKIKSFQGIKSEYYCYDIREAKGIAKFLSIYSDLTSFFTAPSKKDEYHIHLFREGNPRNIKREIDIPPTLTNTALTKGYPIIPSFLYKNDTETKSIAKIIGPFLESGQFILRPIRTLLVNLPKGQYNTNHEIYFASADTPDNHWVVKNVNEEDTYTIDTGFKQFNSQTFFELTLPFFDKASTSDIAKVLEDETDLISNFRALLKDLSEKLIGGESAENIRNYIIKPEIERLNRKFNNLSQIHRLSIGASVAYCTLSLIGFEVNALANFQTLFNALIGTSALGFIASEIRYKQELDKLKDSSYFLLWKISKIK